MPLYQSTYPLALMNGISFYFFNAESPIVPAKSVSIAVPGNAKGLYNPLIFVVQFNLTAGLIPSGNPALTDTIILQGAMTDADNQYQNIYQSVNKQQDFATDFALWPFYRVLLSAWNGVGTLTASLLRK